MVRSGVPTTLALSLALAGTSSAQETRAADPADVESLDAIVAALYDVISGEAGEPRDWDRMHSLFIPGARLIPSGPNPEGEFGYVVWTLDEWIQQAEGWFTENPFYEREIGRATHEWGSLVQMFSAYDSRTSPDAAPFARGINSIQAMHDGERWWIVTVYWTAEREDLPIPEDFIGG
jgi:hypothetical protein